jgi:lysophospholipase L1-like esterase
MYTTPITDDLVRGAIELEHSERGVLPHRLPAWARALYPDGQLAMAESQPAGVKLAFRSTARVIELDTIPTKRVYVGLAPRPDGVYDLVADGRLIDHGTVSGGDRLTIDMTTGRAERAVGEAGTVRFTGLSGGEKNVEIWLPHDERTILVALRTDQPVTPVPSNGRRRWLHHGSSISQGSNAATPTATWPVIAAALGGVELTNLGFGGSALLDPFLARVIRDLPADLISVKVGINLVNTDAMRLPAFGPAVHGFLDTIREGHPSTPLLVISPVLCPIHEYTPGPTAPDMTGEHMTFRATGDPAEIRAGKLTLDVIRRELEHLVADRAATDSQLHYLDGRALYGDADTAEFPLPDHLHPTNAAHRRMGERFAARIFPGNKETTRKLQQAL